MGRVKSFQKRNRYTHRKEKKNEEEESAIDNQIDREQLDKLEIS